MGSYLLKGYALLDDYCDECQTPLMKDKTNALVCVACTIRGVKTPSYSVSAPRPSNSIDIPPTAGLALSDHHPEFAACKRALLDKLQWATAQLDVTNSVSESIELCSLMKLCADTIKTLDTV
jgi:hypothetical protein